MLGFKFIKTQPTHYVIVHKNGSIVREGTGLSFLSYMPTSTISVVPLSSFNRDFMFEQNCADFQSITIQGQVSYRIADPVKMAERLNFAMKDNQSYISDDPQKLSAKVVKIIEGLSQKIVLQWKLREALLANNALGDQIFDEAKNHPEIVALGLSIISVAIMRIHPQPETARALEAEAREAILKAADDAIFLRRNAAVENERLIRENELDTQIAVELKKRNIREAEIDADASIQQKQQEINKQNLLAEIELEEERKIFVARKADNERTMAEVDAYRISSMIEAIKVADPRVIQALTASGMQPAQLIAQAFTGIADKADKIGQLNLSPDLLQTLLAEPARQQPCKK